MRIGLRIDRLVVDDSLLAGERAPGICHSLERELVRLLSAPGAGDILRRIGAVDVVSPTPLPAASDRRVGLGTRVAAAVGMGMGLDDADRPLPSRGHGSATHDASQSHDVRGGHRA